MIDEILAKIEQFNTIIIHRHERPDPDALGSQVGLKKIIEATYRDKIVKVTGYTEPSLAFLSEMDVVTDDLYQEALVIVCDTANTPRIDDKRYTCGKALIKIDHHPEVDSYGDVSWVDPSMSSTSEMVYQLATSGKNKMTLTDEAARLLYAGIIGDTGRFLYPSTTEQTLHVAAELVRYMFDRTLLYNQLYETKPAVARLKGYLLTQLDLSQEGVTYVKLTANILKEYNVTSEETSALVGTYGDVLGINAWVIFVEEPTQIRVRLRSKGPHINGLAAKYNGGGHPLASGAKVKTWEEADQLVVDLKAICAEYTK
ncbi:oligoribonuclease [Halolactibacillus alkaliphilus]|uniref:Oligoribonuclease n=1 Tax=Halolactibacillus alkaliphilus TaxID=442899 RepID=A0A511X2V3_9BACI|nr:bifunctional oligoribonuclease/PAP phosphatase NrnA [Halolactibacillus alkaliphilus]GEN57268.1 oligoribonuclease [Halolactibacillus alkaliphilus]GGN72550.1 oligoribonuclease [Halolactibacillus alkaliphilus]SFO89977.1 phosphoesterase RecJ domain-containing protein [Halolactibacillus alkaliphilus]